MPKVKFFNWVKSTYGEKVAVKFSDELDSKHPNADDVAKETMLRVLFGVLESLMEPRRKEAELRHQLPFSSSLD